MDRNKLKIIMKVFTFVIFAIIIGYQLYNILCNTGANVTSDMASTVLLANEQINTRQLFPDGFYYSTGIFTVHLNLLIIPFMLFIKDWLLCRKLAVIVQTVIGIFCIFILFKKVLKNNAWIYCGMLAVMLILMPINFTFTYFCYYEAVYFLSFMFEIIILIFLFNLFNSKKFLPAAIWYVLIVVLLNLNNTRNIVTIMVPIFLTLIVYTFVESDCNIKNMTFSKKWIYLLALTVLGTGIGMGIFKLIGLKVGFLSSVAGKTFSSWDQIGNNILKLINSLLALYGASGVSTLISFLGIMHPIKLLYAFLCILVVPFYTIKYYKKIENQDIRFLVIFLIISNLLNIYIGVFTTAAGEPKYLIPIYFNNIILLAISTQVIREVQNYKVAILCIMGIFAMLVIGVWEIQIDNDDHGQNSYVNNIVNIMRERNIKYGYADFFDAYGPVMMSNGEITMVAFDNRDLRPYYWLTSEKWYSEENFGGRHCILVNKGVDINEIYYIYADEIVNYGTYTLLIYDDCIIQNLKDNVILEQEIALSSLNITDMAYRYNNSLYLKNGGMQHGPYVELKAGKYIVEIEGKFLKSAIPSVLADNGLENIDINILEYDEEYLKYSFTLNDDKEGVELILRNNSADIVEISKVRYTKIYGDDVNQSPFKQIELQGLSIGDNAVNGGIYIELEQGGMQFGPYINLGAGTYEVEITGKNLSCGQPNVLAQDGQETIDIEIKESNDDNLIYTFQIADNKERVEFTLRNTYNTMIHIYSLGYRKID